jgi:hypothetical protein
MAQSAVNISLGKGSLGGNATGTDYIRGLQLYGTAPGSFATTACQAVFSLQDAVTKGISNDYSDETAATGTYLITTKGNTGDTINATITIPVPVTETYPLGTMSVDTGTYTVGAGDTTIPLQGAAWAAKINAGTYLHGFTASFTTATLTITAKKGLGVALNSGTPIAITLTGAFVGTLTQFSGGVYSKKERWYYHVSEFFRANVNGKLWINFTASPSTDFAEVGTLISQSNGECLMVGVYSFAARTALQVASDTTALQAIADAAFASYKYCQIVYTPNIKAISDLSTLYNGQLYQNKFVAVCILQDGAAQGATLAINGGVATGAIGCLLGTSSKAAVSQEIGEVQAFNLTNGTELNVPAFMNGVLVKNVSNSFLETLGAYRYIYGYNEIGYAGTFFSDAWTFTANTSDYNSIQRVLPILKACQKANAAYTPLKKSRLYLNADGTLTNETIQVFQGAINPSLNQMQTEGDISAYAIIIPASQNVTATATISIEIDIVPVAIARTINVKLTYVANL